MWCSHGTLALARHPLLWGGPTAARERWTAKSPRDAGFSVGNHAEARSGRWAHTPGRVHRGPSLEHAAHEGLGRYQRQARLLLAGRLDLRLKGFGPRADQEVKATAYGAHHAVSSGRERRRSSQAGDSKNGKEARRAGHDESPRVVAVATGGGPLPWRGIQEGRRSPVS